MYGLQDMRPDDKPTPDVTTPIIPTLKVCDYYKHKSQITCDTKVANQRQASRQLSYRRLMNFSSIANMVLKASCDTMLTNRRRASGRLSSLRGHRIPNYAYRILVTHCDMTSVSLRRGLRRCYMLTPLALT
jgi:hypothetical protein